ncbi:hypothetical protein G1H11_13570 [Phytoactinopolyspora alkaliphila]|uniref:DUF8094 domain-containing protein n=1 Tax=Phytoactinopolyspora alkaliphila TaxID=1783498 RepID=A0A6N9YN18_9ACTN|nr:hypothetical protein [Phytoactinopolyspora alkaliphila]NED96337.1 hypothetical protein [Phytoactinopolyspora alkaliphila]
MRIFLGVLLLVLGLPVLLVGAAGAVYVGTDDTVGVVDEQVTTEYAVIATSPSLLELSGPTLHVAADGGGTDVFVGAAHPVHVASYLEGVSVQQVDDAGWRSEFSAGERAGEAAEPAAPPAGLDWWREQSVGAGEQRISFELTDEPVQVVIAGTEFEAPLSVRVVAEAEFDGLFLTLVVVAGIGAILVIAGFLLIRSGRRRKRTASRNGEPAPESPDDAEVTEPTPLRPAGGPPSPPPAPGPSGTLPRLAAAVGLGSLILTGCAQLPDDADHAAHSSVPAVTPAAAEAFFAHYTETNNAANAGQDTELISTVETGPLLTSSLMSYEIQEAQDRDPIEAFTVAPELVAAPELDSYPMWFMARAEPEDAESGPAYYLLTREDAAAPWLAELSVYTSADAALIDPLVTGGVAVRPDEQLVAVGGDVLTTLVEYAETGEEPDTVDVSQAGGLNSLHESGLEIVEGPEDPVNVERDCSLAGTEPRWLATTSGAVALAAVTCTQQVTLEDGYSLTLDDAGYGTIPGDTHLTAMDITHGVTVVVSVEEDGSAVVVGEPMLPYEMSHTEQ